MWNFIINIILTNRNNIEIYEKAETLAKVREAYFKVFELLEGKENIRIIDGNGDFDIISSNIFSEIKQIL